MVSNFIALADGPWACYACCVFGNTAKGWVEHGQQKHPVRLLPAENLSEPLVTSFDGVKIVNGSVVKRKTKKRSVPCSAVTS